MQHNLKPEVVPLVVQVLKEHMQVTRRLAHVHEGKMCFCFEGAVCEAYRRAHPDLAQWEVNDPRSYSPIFRLKTCSATHSAPVDVERWATTDGGPMKFDGRNVVDFNDGYCHNGQRIRWYFDDFIKALTP